MKYIIWNKKTDLYWNDIAHEWVVTRYEATKYSLEQLNQMAFRDWGNDDVVSLGLLNLR